MNQPELICPECMKSHCEHCGCDKCKKQVNMKPESICTACGLYNGNHTSSCGWVLQGIHDKLDKILERLN